MSTHLVADVTLYATSEGGKKIAMRPGFGCPCFASKSEPLGGFDGWPKLEDTPMEPGEKRRLEFFFLSGEVAAEAFRNAGKFYLWEGRFIGEAEVVPDEEE